MLPEETQLFGLLNDYSKSQHECFVAEMFPSKTGDEYILCFRPMHIGKAHDGRYACRYMRMNKLAAQKAAITGTLGEEIIAELDRELPELRRSAE